MDTITVAVEKQQVGILYFEKELNRYGFSYTQDFKPISLIMPYKNHQYL